ncbi:hypothetical protein AB0M47_37645 [Hamadaea sp. NPDC051192]|uniref:hypothetical protein n=1 Tax=Hamadaea sp. NPDC051192 TaxID=3154940 RepID=UPI003440CE38
MIDELRRTLRERAATVEARPEPYARLLSRRRTRRRSRGLTVVAAAAAVALISASPAFWPIQRTYDPVPGPPPAAVAPLLNSPTRGSLAGDQEFLRELRERAAAAVNRDRGPGGPYLPSDPDLIKVLFAGDIGSRRIAVVAGLDGRPLRALLQGSIGDDPSSLYASGSGELETAVVATNTAKTGLDRSETYLLLGPAGAGIDRATSVYSSTGVRRTWDPVAADQGFVAYADLTHLERLRVRVGDKVIWEGEAGRPPKVSVTVDVQPVFGRGTTVPASYVQAAANYLANETGIAGPDARFRVLWSDRISMPGTSQGEAYAVVVQAITADGGGPYSTVVFDTGNTDARENPFSTGVAGPPEQAAIMVRLPSFSASVDDRVYVLAPPAAARAEFTDVTGHFVGFSLANGVGWLDTPAGLDTQLDIRDAEGGLLTTRDFTDKDTGGRCDQFDPTICDGLISVR